MFSGFINDAKSAVGEVAARYATRAVIAIIFLIASGFAIAAVTVQLVSSFGHVAAYSMIAGAFAVFGLIAMAAENWRENGDEVAAEKAAPAETASAHVSGSTVEAAAQLPMALLGTLLTSSSGPLSIVNVLKLLGRNISLVVLAAIIALLLWPTEQTAADASTPDDSKAEPDAAPEQTARAA